MPVNGNYYIYNDSLQMYLTIRGGSLAVTSSTNEAVKWSIEYRNTSLSPYDVHYGGRYLQMHWIGPTGSHAQLAGYSDYRNVMLDSAGGDEWYVKWKNLAANNYYLYGKSSGFVDMERLTLPSGNDGQYRWQLLGDLKTDGGDDSDDSDDGDDSGWDAILKAPGFNIKTSTGEFWTNLQVSVSNNSQAGNDSWYPVAHNFKDPSKSHWQRLGSEVITFRSGTRTRAYEVDCTNKIVDITFTDFSDDLTIVERRARR